MKTLRVMVTGVLLFISSGASAQFVVSDPTLLAQSIINSSENIVHTSSTARSMQQAFQQTVKIYEQGKDYYDSLRKVSNQIRSMKKVTDSILLLGEITDIYVTGFRRILKTDVYSREELSAISLGYTRLLMESALLVEEVRSITRNGELRMNDAERLQVVDRCYTKLLRYRSLVRYYSDESIQTAAFRSSRTSWQKDCYQFYSLH